MLIVPALEYEKQRQDHTSWNKVILHREGKFYRVYEWSLWLVKTIVCTEEFQKHGYFSDDMTKYYLNRR